MFWIILDAKDDSCDGDTVSWEELSRLLATGNLWFISLFCETPYRWKMSECFRSQWELWKALTDTGLKRLLWIHWNYWWAICSCPLPPLFLPASSKFRLTCWNKKGIIISCLNHHYMTLYFSHFKLWHCNTPRPLTSFQSTPCCKSINTDKSPLILMKLLSRWRCSCFQAFDGAIVSKSLVLLYLPWFPCSSSYSATTLAVIKTS